MSNTSTENTDLIPITMNVSKETARNVQVVSGLIGASGNKVEAVAWSAEFAREILELIGEDTTFTVERNDGTRTQVTLKRSKS